MSGSCIAIWRTEGGVANRCVIVFASAVTIRRAFCPQKMAPLVALHVCAENT
uniref:Uncharacterized protein n=1 Tax=Burkholderia pseudomallei TaxID=28450 RepID=Q6S458_BURPE|nr:unknown [Burkholderia pseudomallei 1026b]